MCSLRSLSNYDQGLWHLEFWNGQVVVVSVSTLQDLKLCHRHQLNEDSKFSKLCWFFAYWIFIIELINPESNMKFRRPLINIFYCLGHILPRHMLKLFYFVSIFAWCSSSRFKQVIDSDDWPQKGRIRKVFNGCSEQIFESLRSSGW